MNYTFQHLFMRKRVVRGDFVAFGQTKWLYNLHLAVPFCTEAEKHWAVSVSLVKTAFWKMPCERLNFEG